MTTFRRTSVALVASVGLLLGVASLAWACTSQPRIFFLSPQSGPRGTQVQVKGEGVAVGGAVEIRWNTLTGESLGRAAADASGDFATAIVVPDVPAGVYSLVGVTGDRGVARMAFQVTGTAGEPPLAPTPSGAVADPWSGTRHSSSPAYGSEVGVGVGLLGAGLVMLFSGFALAAVRRRRRASVPKSNF